MRYRNSRNSRLTYLLQPRPDSFLNSARYSSQSRNSKATQIVLTCCSYAGDVIAALGPKKAHAPYRKSWLINICYSPA